MTVDDAADVELESDGVGVGGAVDVDSVTGTALARYDLAEDASTETALVFGELYRYNGEWKFRAIGQGYASGLKGIALDYGVSV